MDSQLVSFSSPRTRTSDQAQSVVATGSRPFAGMTGAANTPVRLYPASPDPVPGPSWRSERPVMPGLRGTALLSGAPAFDPSLTLMQSLPGPSQHTFYTPLDAMARMVEAVSMATPAHRGRFAWQAVPAAVSRRYTGLAETMVAASQPDTLLNGGGMLEASQRLRRSLAGNRRKVKIAVPMNLRVPLAKVASVYEALHGWGLFRINSEAVTGTAADDEARQDKLLRLRQTISERVITGIHREQLSTTSPVSLQQQQFAEIVREVYQQEKTQALARLNAAVPPAITASGSGWRRFTAHSTRALVDNTEPTDSKPLIALNVQCGEQVALTYALLLHLNPCPVTADQLRMITFSWVEDNHSVLLYSCSPACQLSTLSGDSRAPISADQFITWFFQHRRNVLILNPAAEDSTADKPVADINHNLLKTNKCIAFSRCRSRRQVGEGISSLLQQMGVGLAEMQISIDHPLAEVNESALEHSSEDDDSDHSGEEWDDCLSDAEMVSERGAEFSPV